MCSTAVSVSISFDAIFGTFNTLGAISDTILSPADLIKIMTAQVVFWFKYPFRVLIWEIKSQTHGQISV